MPQDLRSFTILAFDPYPLLQECRRHFLDSLRAFAREAGIHDARALAALDTGAGQLFDDLLRTDRRSGFAQAEGLTASRITLVDDHQLEQELRRDDMARRLHEHCSASLWRLHLRCITLLQRPGLTLKDNPFGPDLICAALAHPCAALEFRLEQTLDLLDRLENVLAENLPRLYEALEARLEQAGVEAAQNQRSIVHRPALQGSTDTAPPGPDPLASLKGALLAGRGGQAMAPAGPAPAPPDGASLERLLDRLRTLEAFTPTNPDLIRITPEASPPPMSLNARKLGVSGPDAATIDALALIFEAIYNQTGLADGARAAIVSLQIPVLKLAIQDSSFFSRPDHPARLTLERMARLAIGLPPQAGFDHPVCRRLNQTAAAIRNSQPTRTALFETAAAELEQAIGERNAQIQALARHYLPLVADIARHDQARQEALKLVQDYCKASLPPTFGDFLVKHWQPVLEAAWLQGGSTGQGWQDARQLMDDLLWSIEPKQSLEERQRLAALVPTLLKRITTALGAIGRSLDAQSPFLDTCLALQTAAMRGRSLTPEAMAPVPLPPETRPALRQIQADGLQLHILEAGAIPPGTAEFLNPGEWFDLPLPDGSRVCGCLCGPGDQGDWLLANPDWDHALLARGGSLAALLRQGLARCCSRTSLLETAAAQAGRLMAERN